MHDLFYNDEILADEALERFSLNPDMQHTDDNPTKFRLYSDYFSIKYPHCYMDDEGNFHPKDDTP